MYQKPAAQSARSKKIGASTNFRCTRIHEFTWLAGALCRDAIPLPRHMFNHHDLIHTSRNRRSGHDLNRLPRADDAREFAAGP